jgi:ABC-type antimicrobial peptide transport system permease subunit
MLAITLGTAFFTTLSLMDAIYRVYAYTEGGSLQVASYQYWLVLISLVVCVVSITNSFLIAVYERYREIGTMKCLGALDQHILKLFLVESIILALFGSSLGFGIGVVASIVTTSPTIGFPIILEVSSSTILVLLGQTVSLSLILCVIATLYPAYKAAKLNPVEALRSEI